MQFTTLARTAHKYLLQNKKWKKTTTQRVKVSDSKAIHLKLCESTNIEAYVNCLIAIKYGNSWYNAFVVMTEPETKSALLFFNYKNNSDLYDIVVDFEDAIRKGDVKFLKI